MKFNRRNAVKAAVAGVIGFFMGGKSHAEPAGEASSALLIAEPCGCSEALPEVLTTKISEPDAGGFERITFVNLRDDTKGPVVVNVVQYRDEAHLLLPCCEGKFEVVELDSSP